LDQRGHLGLAGMSERAREIGWSLSIESRRGQGTRILVSENPPEGDVLTGEAVSTLAPGASAGEDPV
jgi:hypothetical protein